MTVGATHTALTYQRERVFTVEEVETPAPAAGEVAIDVAFTGICGTDLKIAHGAMDARIKQPWPIGHEMVGTIAALGEGVEGWQPGDKVTVMPLRWCGECAACRAGHRHVCQRLEFVGIDSPGSLQQRWNVGADLLVPIPAAVGLADAALVEPVAVAVHDVRRSGLAADDDVVVIGGGPIGLLIALVARRAGAHVLLSEVSPARRSLARRLGFEVSDPRDKPLGQVVQRRTKSKGADVAFEVSGSAAGVEALTEVLAVRGTGVIVAIHPEPEPVDLFAMFWKELELMGARVYERGDFETAVELIASGAIPTRDLITETVPLADAAAAFERLSSAEDVVKLLVDSRR